MKALILAAGYATRLYPLTLNQPKPLLKVAGKAIIELILNKIEEIKEINEIFIVTNDKFYSHFVNWSNQVNSTKQIKIINDGTLSNEDRLGAIGDINFTIKQENINEDLLVIAGDNLFGFSLTNLVGLFKSKESSLVALHDLKEINKVKGKFGVGILDGSKVIDFEEKPLEPRSSLAATACYVFSKSDLSHIKIFSETSSADAPGNLIKYLTKNSQVYAYVFDEYWYDIGNIEALKEAEEKLSL